MNFFLKGASDVALRTSLVLIGNNIDFVEFISDQKVSLAYTIELFRMTRSFWLVQFEILYTIMTNCMVMYVRACCTYQIHNSDPDNIFLRSGMTSLKMFAVQHQLPPSERSLKLTCLQKPTHHSLSRHICVSLVRPGYVP